MKKTSMFFKRIMLLIVPIFIFASIVNAQDAKHERIIDDSKNAKSEFLKSDKLMQSLFDNSYAYVIFPNVGKGAVGVGGAAGTGVVYEKSKMIGTARMTQVTVGLQIGGQAYREVIFFENEEALNRFRDNKFEFAAQTSAVAATSGASSNAKYRDGVLVFSQEKAGLMYEASIGGQKFSYTAF